MISDLVVSNGNTHPDIPHIFFRNEVNKVSKFVREKHVIWRFPVLIFALVVLYLLLTLRLRSFYMKL